jgi:hypothetical protein
LLLESGLGNTNALGILLQGDSVYQPDQMEFDDIYMSAVGGLSHWFTGFEAYGNARTAPQGIRVASINNVQVFNCRNAGVYLSNVVQWSMINFGVYTGTGSGSNFYIAGGGSPQTNSVQVFGQLINVQGVLSVSNASRTSINGTNY